MKVTDKSGDSWKDLQRLPSVTRIQAGIFQEEGDEEHRMKDGAGRDRLTVLDIAEIHEFGLGVPQRSFLRAWFDSNEANIQLRFLERLNANGPKKWAQACAQLALWIEGDIRKFVRAHIPPPLAEATIRKKKSSTPLIDTGHLVASITARVDAEPPE